MTGAIANADTGVFSADLGGCETSAVHEEAGLAGSCGRLPSLSLTPPMTMEQLPRFTELNISSLTGKKWLMKPTFTKSNVATDRRLRAQRGRLCQGLGPSVVIL